MPRYASRVEARSSSEYNARKLTQYISQGRPIPQWLERAIGAGVEGVLESLLAERERERAPTVDEGEAALEAMRAARRAAAPAPAPRPAPAPAPAAASIAERRERLAALRASVAARAAANHRAGAALRARNAALRAATYVDSDSDSDDSWEDTSVPVVARAAAAPRQFAAPLPAHLLESLKAALTAADKKTECPICMEEHAPCDTDYSNCGHAYCKPCLNKLKATSESGSTYKCAVCRAETAK